MFSNLRRSVARLIAPETRNYAGGSGWLAPPTQAGITVTPETALNFSGVFAAINVISSDVAALPCMTYRRTPSGGKRPDRDHYLYDMLLCEPNRDISAFHFTQAMFGHALGHGNAYAQILRDGDGFPRELNLLEPRDWRAQRNQANRVYYRSEKGETLRAEDVLHLKGLSHDGVTGRSVVGHARQTIGLGMAAEIFGASYYGNGAAPRGFLKTPKKLSTEAKDDLREEFYRKHGGPYRAHQVGILAGDYEWMDTPLSAEDAQFLATRAFSIVEICRWFNISPIRLQDYTKTTYSTYEQSQLDHVTTTLRPWVIAWESELNRKLLPSWERREIEIRHDFSARLRGDIAARTARSKELFGLGSISRNEIRDVEEMDEIEGGDRYYLAANNYAPLDADGVPQVPANPSKPAGPTALPPTPAPSEPKP